MLPRLVKVFQGRFNWQRLFQGWTLLLTNTVVGGIMSGLGDLVQQNWENHKTPGRTIDWKRQGDLVVVGCAFGPVVHYWYTALDRVLPGKAVKTVVKKLLVEQIIGSPFWILCFFLAMALQEGHGLSKGWNEYREKFWEVYLVDCCIWIPAQLINFYYFKPKYRVVFIFSVTLLSDTYLSYIKYRIRETHPTELVSDSSAVDVQQEALPSSKPLEEKA
ncbi:mpv17-like protein 2 [Sebastes fasciatus]|uniref:mpv17-like protein 2 n=1 Tax=Sebastes fasciatus TaxID=394691 RepID=UPI003D9EB8D0